MMTIGLTGGMAAGKSTVAARLCALGARVIDADAVARELVAPGQPALAAICARFGPVLLPDGTLDRRRLGELVFGAPAALAALNGILHPAIKGELLLRARLPGPERAVVLDVPLLLECGWQTMVDEVWLVCAPESLRLARVAARDGLTEQAARRRMAEQMPDDEKRALAHVVFENTGGLAALTAQVDAAWARLTGGRP